ncbi:MAG: energy transducer TonB [Neisseria sp.]|nr:energy transducer TonB [Neisseria sp.]
MKRIFLFAFAVLATTTVHAMPEQSWQNMGVRQGVIDKNGKPITGIVTATAIVDKEGKLGKSLHWEVDALELLKLAQEVGLPKQVEPYKECTYNQKTQQTDCKTLESLKKFRFFYTVPNGFKEEIKTKPVQVAPPPYPELSTENGEEGTVVLNVFINIDGKAFVWVKKSSGYSRLDAAGRKAVLQTKFQPATYHGKPVTMFFTRRIAFILN